jgi:hypothetical protein
MTPEGGERKGGGTDVPVSEKHAWGGRKGEKERGARARKSKAPACARRREREAARQRARRDPPSLLARTEGTLEGLLLLMIARLLVERRVVEEDALDVRSLPQDAAQQHDPRPLGIRAARGQPPMGGDAGTAAPLADERDRLRRAEQRR